MKEVSGKELELILSRIRMSSANKEIARDILFYGQSVSETAKEHGISKQRVHAIVKRVRKEISENNGLTNEELLLLEKFAEANQQKRSLILAMLMLDNENYVSAMKKILKID